MSLSSSSTSTTPATAAAVQALLEESNRSLAERVKQQQEQWTQEDKKFLLKFNEAMRHIPSVVAHGIQERIDQVPRFAVDVPELARSLATALNQPIGLAFKEQFTDVLIPALEDTTAKMLRTVDAKMKSVATQHAQTIATNDVARSVEPLVASLMHATTEMTKSISNLKVPQFPSAPTAEPALKFPNGSSSNGTTQPISAATTPAPTTSTPTKPRSGSGSTPAAVAPVSSTKPTKSGSTAAEKKAAAKAKKESKQTNSTSEKVESAPETTTSTSKAAPSNNNSNTKVNTVSIPHPPEYWFFALKHSIHL